jgi:hypothetical protein
MTTQNNPGSSSPPDPFETGRSRLEKIGIGVVTLLLLAAAVIALTHVVQTEPPPHFLKSFPPGDPIFQADDENYTFTEVYYISVPCDLVNGQPGSKDARMRDRVFVGIFNEDGLETNGSLSVMGTSGTGSVDIMLGASDYMDGGQGGDTCTATVPVRFTLPILDYPGDEKLKMAFYVVEHSPSVHRNPSPWFGRGWLERPMRCYFLDRNTLKYYTCLDESGTHGADHVFISPINNN